MVRASIAADHLPSPSVHHGESRTKAAAQRPLVHARIVFGTMKNMKSMKIFKALSRPSRASW